MSEQKLSEQKLPEQKLSELYYAPGTGLLGQDKFYRKARSLGLQVTKKEIAEFLAKQATHQQHQVKKKPKKFLPFKAARENHIWQCDLMFMDPAYSRINGGYSIILCCVDVFSRKAYCRLLKTKGAGVIVKAFADIFEESVPVVIQTDNGKEFTNREVAKLFASHEIKHELHEAGDHQANGIVERFNRTIRGVLEKYQTAYNTKKWADAFPLILENYNSSFHSGIDGIPNEATANKEKIIARMYGKQTKASAGLAELAVGDNVRFAKNRILFQKGALPKWTATVYTVEEKKGKVDYRLSNDKWYRVYELLKVPVVEERQEPRSEEKEAEMKEAVEMKQQHRVRGVCELMGWTSQRNRSCAHYDNANHKSNCKPIGENE